MEHGFATGYQPPPSNALRLGSQSDGGDVVVVSATSSSIYSDNRNNWGPQLAWSGGSDTYKGLFHSELEDNPWLEIQLQPPVILSGVTVINRKDGFGERLRNLQVRAGMSPGFGSEVVGTFEGPGTTGEEHVIQFRREVVVEYLTFQIIGNEYLQINGIELNKANANGDYWMAVANTSWGRIPGKAQEGTCWYSYNGEEHSTDDFDWVTHPTTMVCLPNTGDGPPPGTRPVGYQNDGRGDQYAVIANTEWGRIPGKACSDSCCWYPYGGTEYETDDFQWLSCTRVSNPYHEKMDIDFVHSNMGFPENGLNLGWQDDGGGEQCIAVADTCYGKIPGKAKDGTCWYSYNGEEHTTEDFHYVVQASPHSLVPNNFGGPPPGAVASGFQEDGRGDQYAVVAFSQWGRIPGKACGNTCWYPYGGREHETSDFEWLVFSYEQ